MFWSLLFGEQVFPLSTCPSSSPETWEPLFHMKLLFMYWNLFSGEKVVPLSTCPSSLKRHNRFLKQNCCSCFGISFWVKSVSRVDLSLLLTSNAGSIVSNKIAVHVLELLVLVKQFVSCRFATLTRNAGTACSSKIDVHGFKLIWLVKKCLLCRPTSHPLPKRGTHFFEPNCGSWFETCVVWNTVSLVELSFLFTSNVGTYVSSKIAVHVSKLFFVGENVCPWSTCPSSSLQTRERLFQVKLLFMMRNLKWWKGVSLVDLPLLLTRKRWNHLFKHLCCLWLETKMVVNNCFLRRLVRPHRCNRGKLLFEQNCGSHFEISLLGEHAFPLSTCTSSSLHTREPLFQARWLFMVCKEFLGEHVVALSTCLFSSPETREPLFQTQRYCTLWNLFLANKCFPCRLAFPHHPQRGNQLCKQNCRAWFQTCFYEHCFLCRLVPPPHFKRLLGEQVFPVSTCPVLLNSNADITFSTKIIVHVLKLVICWWTIASSVDLPLLSPDRREPPSQAKLLCMFWNLFFGEQVFSLPTCPLTRNVAALF